MDKQNSRKKNSIIEYINIGINTAKMSCVFALILMLAIIIINIILRYFFKMGFMFVDEYSGYLLVFMVFMGLSFTAKADAHVKVDLAVRKLSERIRHIFEIFTTVLCLLLMLIYLFSCYQYFLECLTTNRQSITTRTPLWIPLVPMIIGLICLIIERSLHVFYEIKILHYKNNRN